MQYIVQLILKIFDIRQDMTIIILLKCSRDMQQIHIN